MIALVGVEPPDEGTTGIATLHGLPAEPASGFVAVMVRCRSERAVEETLGWHARIRAARPAFVLGLVGRPRHCAGPLGRCEHRVSPVVSPAELDGGVLPVAALSELRARSIEGLILEELGAGPGEPLLAHRTMVESMIAHAVHGGTLNSTARDLGRSTVWIWRRVRSAGLDAGALMRWTRLRAYNLRLELGVTRTVALDAGGWSNHGARLKALARCRQALDRNGLPEL